MSQQCLDADVACPSQLQPAWRPSFTAGDPAGLGTEAGAGLSRWVLDDQPVCCSPLRCSAPHVKSSCRVVAGLGTAMRALQLAPVETARAVAVTLDGTAAMLGQACGQLSAAAKSGLEDSAQRLGVTSRQAKASLSDRACIDSTCYIADVS